MKRFSVFDTPLSGLQLVERRMMGDDRGFLSRLFCSEELVAVGWHKPIEQINHTYTKHRGTVRGMHYQLPPHAEIKLVSCIKGEIWDVAVDLRKGSPTFLHWHAEKLTAANQRALLIPEGFAHGFQTLTDDVELLYCHSAPYVQSAEMGLNPTDPRLNISWPLKISHLSERDKLHPMLDNAYTGVVV